MMGMVGTSDFILQLYSIVLHPDESISTRSSASRAAPEDLDIDIFSINYTSASLRAYQLLQTFLCTNGPSRLLSNLPRRNTDIPSLPAKRQSHLLDLKDKDDLEELTETKLAARRLGESKDVWEIVAGRTGKEGARMRVEEGEAEAVSRNGWKVLELLVQAWEKERDLLAAEGEEAPYSPSLLSQFSVAGTALPSDFTAILNIIFEPFSPAASERSSLFQETELVMRLLDLLAELAEASKVSQPSLLRDITERMKDLKVPEFKELVVNILNKHPNLKIRLFTRYLDRYSAEVQVITLDDSPPTSLSKAVQETLSDYEGEIQFVRTVQSSPPKASPSSQTELQTSLQTGKGSSNAPKSGGPIPSASPRRNASQSSLSPSKQRPIVDPIHTPAPKAISNLFCKIPKELDPSRPIKKAPKRTESDGTLLTPSPGPSQKAINAELKFAAVKLELLRIFVHFARLQGEKELVPWMRVVVDGRLKRAMRNGRKQLANNGELPEQIKRLEMVEDAVLSTVL